jgi:hypothetical protein
VTADRLHVLVLSTFDGTNANVIRDYLFAFRTYSRHRYSYLFDCATLDSDVDLSAFDVVLLFWSLYDLRTDLHQELRARIRAAPACKVLFLQDEYREVRTTNRIMSELGINLMFTCVAERDHDLFYPPHLIPSLQGTYTVLTGYVPDYLERHVPDFESRRPLDVGYRSRDAPYYLGDLGRQKRLLADRFPAVAAANGLTCDISVREHDRVYGRRWTRFLQSARCVLGSASGASVVDFTGQIRSNCDRHLALHPKATYEEVKRRFFADTDWKVVIDTVSPRVLEAAAAGSTLVHHEGGYGGLLEPDVHYIRLACDYGNVADVVDRIKDHGFCRELALRTRRDLIDSRRFSYRGFGQWFDAVLDRHVPARRRARQISNSGIYARAYVRRRQPIVPFGSSFIVLPSGRLVLRLGSRAVGSLAAPATGLPAQLIDNPAELAGRAMHAFKVIRRSAPLGALLREYWRDPATRSEVGLYEMVNELVKVDLVARARSAALESREPFGVTVGFDPLEGVIEVASYPGCRVASDGAGPPGELVEAIRSGTLRAVIWDHSAVGMQVVYRIAHGNSGGRGAAATRRGWMRVRVGPNGVFKFAGLAALGRRAPDRVGAALLELLAGPLPQGS